MLDQVLFFYQMTIYIWHHNHIVIVIICLVVCVFRVKGKYWKCLKFVNGCLLKIWQPQNLQGICIIGIGSQKYYIMQLHRWHLNLHKRKYSRRKYWRNFWNEVTSSEYSPMDITVVSHFLMTNDAAVLNSRWRDFSDGLNKGVGLPRWKVTLEFHLSSYPLQISSHSKCQTAPYVSPTPLHTFLASALP